jgi:hypothetical protein
MWADPGQGVGGSWLAAKFLKIDLKKILYKNMKILKNLKLEYISAARQVNPSRPYAYFWTLFCPELIKLMF